MPMFLPTGAVNDMPAELVGRVRNPYYRDGIPEDLKAQSKKRHEEKVREAEEKRKKRENWLKYRNNVENMSFGAYSCNEFVGYCDWNMMSYYGGIKELDPQFPLTPTCCEVCNNLHGAVLPFEEQESPGVATSYDENGALKVEPILDRTDPEDNIVLSSNYGAHIPEKLTVTVIGLLPKNADDLKNLSQWSFNEWFDLRYGNNEEPTKVACLFLSGQVNYTFYYTDNKGVLQTKNKSYGFFDKLWSKQYFSVYTNVVDPATEWHQGDNRFHPRFKDIMRDQWVYTWEPLRSPNAQAYRLALNTDRNFCLCSHWGSVYGIDFFPTSGYYACTGNELDHETLAPHMVFQNAATAEAYQLQHSDNKYLNVMYKQENEKEPLGWTRMANSPVLKVSNDAIEDALIVTPVTGKYAFSEYFNNALHPIDEWDIWRQYIRKYKYTLTGEDGETKEEEVSRIRYIPGMLLNDGTRKVEVDNATPDPEHIDLSFEWVPIDVTDTNSTNDTGRTVGLSGTFFMTAGQSNFYSYMKINWTLTQELDGEPLVESGSTKIYFKDAFVRKLDVDVPEDERFTAGYAVYLGAGRLPGGEIIGTEMEGCTYATLEYTVQYFADMGAGEDFPSEVSETIEAEVHEPNGDFDKQIARNRWKLRKIANKYKSKSGVVPRNDNDGFNDPKREILDNQFVESSLYARQTTETTSISRPAPQTALVLEQHLGISWAEQIKEGEHKGKYNVRIFGGKMYLPFKVNIRVTEWDSIFRKYILERCNAHYSFTAEQQEDKFPHVFDFSDGAYSHNWIGVNVPWEMKESSLEDILPVCLESYGTSRFSLMPRSYYSITYDDIMLTAGLLANNGLSNTDLPLGSRWGVLGYATRNESDKELNFPFNPKNMDDNGSYPRCTNYNTRILSYETVDNATMTPTLVPFKEAYSLPMEFNSGGPLYLNLFISDPEEKDVLARISFPVEFRQALIRDNRTNSYNTPDRYFVKSSFGGAAIPGFAQYFESQLNGNEKIPYLGARVISAADEPFFKVIDESQYNFEAEEEEE